MKYREAARKLQALGCHELPRRKGGSHRKWFNPITGKATVLPDWGGKDLKWGTLRSPGEGKRDRCMVNCSIVIEQRIRWGTTAGK